MLARYLGTSVALQCTGLGLMFLAQLALARALGAQEFGIYAYSNAWLMSLVLIARFGFDITVLRFGGGLVGGRDWTRFASLLRVSNSAVLWSSAAAMSVMMVLSLVEAHSRPRSTLSEATFVASIIIPVLAASGLRQSALLACGRGAQALIPECVVRPTLIGIGAVVMAKLWFKASAPYAMAVNFAATATAYALGRHWLRRATPADRAFETVAADRATWIKSSMLTVVLAGAQQLLAQIDLLVGGVLVAPGALGHYAASRQLASVGALGLIAFQYSSSPRIATAYVNEDFSGLSRVLRAIAWGGVGFAVLYGAAAAMLGSWMLGLFGKGFPDANNVLLLLLAGQVLIAAGGPAGTVASMVGLQRGAAVIAIVAAVGCALLATLLSVRFGILGVAFAGCLSMAAWNVGVNVLIYNEAGFSVWIGSPFVRKGALRIPDPRPRGP